MSTNSIHKLNIAICFNVKSTIADNCGDHVVVINTGEIALPGEEWKKRVYFHHTGFSGGATWTLAWELHQKDQTQVTTIKCETLFQTMLFIISLQIVHKAVYNAMKGTLQRRYNMQRLHLFPGTDVPEEIMANVTNQLRQSRLVPKRLDHIDAETVAKFPKIMDFPKDYVLR